jgi:hypothetical protein
MVCERSRKGNSDRDSFPGGFNVVVMRAPSTGIAVLGGLMFAIAIARDSTLRGPLVLTNELY